MTVFMTVPLLSVRKQAHLTQEKQPQCGQLNGRSVRQIPSDERSVGFNGVVFEGLASLFVIMAGAILFFASAYATKSLGTATVITAGVVAAIATMLLQCDR